MRFLDKMERKFGRYAIRNLPLIMIVLLVAGYTLSALFPSAANYYAFIPPYIMRGEIWRLITWVLMPPSRLDIFTVIMLLFYCWIARTLAATWGDFLFNVYIFGGILITDIGMMLTYAFLNHAGTTDAYMQIMYIPAFMTTYYILTTILIAYALTYPNMQVLLYFFIPVKMSWMGILYGAFIAYDFFRAKMLVPRVVIACALLNFAVYFLMTSNLRHLTPSELKRKAKFRKAVGSGKKEGSGSFFGGFGAGKSTPSGGYTRSNDGTGSRQGQGAASARSFPGRRAAQDYTKIYPNGARHKCTICGRTELDDPNLEFRYCSKCEGSHEYCQDHLFTHKHIKNGVPAEPQG